MVVVGMVEEVSWWWGRSCHDGVGNGGGVDGDGGVNMMMVVMEE